ncbi:class I SAM-dependent methyltransferase [Streptomyces beijiangensis]|uniref:Class I SAM-dependent methyltransferase n=1 Tax=Streptomyces beijiangensis TaxID=163361 RepID=A0A939JL64_9ACTN|nr:class I SAM-dependent methyltransferase [Streptomyces beijiangensis]MBO0516557.1 class I SAM-dependent methyltransferase [Streptomyces beijiangensis]
MSETTREGYGGTGPGARTPDGCSVDLYRRLPVGEEPDIIAAAVPAGARILELGSGAGRVTRPLTARGFAVTAVDESPQMLEAVEQISGVRTVRSSIEKLALDETFDVVMLASYLVHFSDPQVRDAMLRTCRRHVTDDGCVLIQREGLDWHTRLPRERDDGAGGTIRIRSAAPAGDGVDTLFCEYIYPDATWTQTFQSRALTKEEFEHHLDEAGLYVDKYLTDDGTWVRVLPRR